ncbi:MAG: outer membrane protein assembly factor BamD [Candidatus Acidiferrales bacterium]
MAGIPNIPNAMQAKKRIVVFILGAAFCAMVCAPAFAQKVRKVKTAPKPADDTAQSAEPDKVLYVRATNDIKHGRYTEGRLALQTLINTYPDSEYLAKAKLSIADSYYKEGGTSNLTQAIQTYKDFITFFPFLDEASYAQMQVGMAHYKMMEKADRDNAQAEDAEDEFQAFLLKYPQSPLVPQAEQHLRDVQEVLAAGEFEVAHYYYTKPDFRAAAARLIEITDRYPLYSGSGEALWMLGDIYQRAKQVSKNEDDKNHWSDLAAKCYDSILQDYPMSRRAADAKARLTAMGMPVPSADPSAYARMAQEQKFQKVHGRLAMLRMPMALINSKPDISGAAHTGMPNLNPPTDEISATDVLKEGAAGPTFGVIAPGDAAPATSDASGPTTQVDAQPNGAPITGDQGGSSVGAEIIAAPTAGSDASSSNPPAQTPAATNDTSAPNSSVPLLTPTSVTPATTPAAADSSTNGAPITGNSESVQGASPSATGDQPATPSANSGSDSGSANQPASSTDDSKNESTSKKKKGLRKLVPW